MNQQPLPIFLLPGMSPQYPVYDKLQPLLPNVTVVPFLNPYQNEDIVSYAKRMAEKFPAPCFIGGVSFGGILAQEISRLVQPVGCIVIASVRDPKEMPPWLRLTRILGGRNSSQLIKATDKLTRLVPRKFCPRSSLRLSKLSSSWHRWATKSVLNWSPKQPLPIPTTHIHGEADATFPVRYTNADTIITHGRHALPISHPQETANAIQSFMELVA